MERNILDPILCGVADGRRWRWGVGILCVVVGVLIGGVKQSCPAEPPPEAIVQLPPAGSSSLGPAELLPAEVVPLTPVGSLVSFGLAEPQPENAAQPAPVGSQPSLGPTQSPPEEAAQPAEAIPKSKPAEGNESSLSQPTPGVKAQRSPEAQGDVTPPVQEKPVPPGQKESVLPAQGISAPPGQGQSMPPAQGPTASPGQGESVPAGKQPASEGSSRKIQGPRDLLALFGMDQSHFRRLTDGSPLVPGEEELLLKLLFRSVEFPLKDLERWAHRSFRMEELAKSPESWRGEVFWVRGRVQKMEVCQPLPEAAQRYLMDQYYRCELVVEESQQPVVVYVQQVPHAWLNKPPKNERAGVLGFFLKTTSSDPQKPMPMLAGHRMAWYPAGLLGDLGMDVGLLDGVVDRQSILPEERETFYQLLAAMQRGKPGQILQAARQQAQLEGVAADSVVPLFKEPASQRGRLVLLRGAARKVVRVEVPDSDIQARFGIDHYYEISLFTPDSEGHPVIVCVPTLPSGMPTGEGIQYVEEVEVAGFFLKSWSYRVPPPPDAPPEKRSDMIVWKRQAPLLIGPTPVWYPREETSPHTVAAVVAGLLFVVAGIGLWWAMWRAHRTDEQFRRRFLAERPPSESTPFSFPPQEEKPLDSSDSDQTASKKDQSPGNLSG